MLSLFFAARKERKDGEKKGWPQAQKAFPINTALSHLMLLKLMVVLLAASYFGQFDLFIMCRGNAPFGDCPY